MCKDHDHTPSTASSMLASSKTMKGALPPASKDTLHTQVQGFRKSRKKEKNRTWNKTNFFKVLAAILYNSFATGVDPVKLTFLTILFSHISLPTSRTFFWVVTILMTPSGIPARRLSYSKCYLVNKGYGNENKSHLSESKGREWSLRWWLDDCSTSCSEGCAKFPCNHSGREIPWRQDGAVGKALNTNDDLYPILYNSHDP